MLTNGTLWPRAESEDAQRMPAATPEAEIARLSGECERLRAFAVSSCDWLWETDADHRFVWLSEGFVRATGIPLDNMLGRRQWDVASQTMDVETDLWMAHIADLSARRPFRDFRYWQEDLVGRVRWIKISGSPRFTADGHFSGFIGTGVDVTDAVESAHRMNMLSRAVDQCPASIVITNLDGAIQYVNQKFVEVTGYSLEEVVGQNPRVLNSGRNPPDTFERMWAALSAGSQWEGELINRRKNGELYWEHASIQPIQNIEGVITNYLAIKSDITDQRRNEARLAALVEELRQSNEELEQFAYVASHDLRQPLRMISAYLALIEKRLAGQADEEFQTFLGFALDGARRLDRMIVDLLQYSRIGRVSVPMEAVDLGEVIRDSLRHLDVAIAESGATIRVALDFPVCTGDRSELVRLFQNLIGNALIYVRSGHSPEIEVAWRDIGTEYALSVKDNGTGIAEDDLNRVFGIFQRLVPRDKVEGTGIGLAICRKIADHHGGRIWVESVLDQGSTFWVALPKPVGG